MPKVKVTSAKIRPMPKVTSAKAPPMLKLPFEKLRSLASSNKANEFKQILEADLYPFLDGLPAAQQKSLLDILNNTSKPNEAVELVGFDTRSESISGGLRALLKMVKTDWKNGWEEQGEMMSEVVGELCEWLPILWKVGVEMGVEHALVHKSLMFCKSSHDRLGNTNSRAEFSDLDPPERRIKDATGKLVYLGTSSTEDTILWVWRELLLSSIVHNSSDTVVKKIVADMKKLTLTKEILERLDDETFFEPSSKKLPKYGTDAFEKIDWELEEKRDLLQNAHWSPEMRAAVPKAKALFA